MQDVNNPNDSAPTNKPQKSPRIVAMGFVFAFALSTATLILTGLNVKAPKRRNAEVQAENAAILERPTASDGSESDIREPEKTDELSPETSDLHQ